MSSFHTETFPPELKAEALHLNAVFLERNPQCQHWFQTQLKNKNFAEQLARTWAASRFVAELCLRHPEHFMALVDQQLLSKSYSSHSLNSDSLYKKLKNRLATLTQSTTDNKSQNTDAIIADFDQQLRQFRQWEMVRIIWRDLNRLADLNETTHDISSLADAAIQQTLNFHYVLLCQRYGTPYANVNNERIKQTLLVLGMGKLGANELNLSSDIDLIFCYPSAGQTDHEKPLDNSEFFTRLARKLINSLDQVTVDGFVFRVDMRLRPYGQSGALVLSIDAMEEYYQSQGRDWERYAMIKCRVVAGNKNNAQELMQRLKPFVYRKYIDFTTIEALRSMKIMIEREVKRRNLDNNIKLGAGGIREIEFIAQSFQLIRGGRDAALQDRRLQKVLGLLAERNCLAADITAALNKAYVFLRNTEHALQAFADKQTQRLPDHAYEQTALAFVMGYADWASFSHALENHRQYVARQFEAIIADSKSTEDTTSSDTLWLRLWLNELDKNDHELLSTQGFINEPGSSDDTTWSVRLEQLRNSRQVLRLQPLARERLDQFMPLLLQAVSQARHPTITLLNILPLVEAVLRRTAYLVLLIENNNALKQLVTLCEGSLWIADRLAKQPVLLDELLDARTLYHVPDKPALRAELQQLLLRLPPEDLEAQMEALRYFKQAHQLHVTAAEITGRLELMKVSDYLTIIAEVIVDSVLDLAWANLAAKHGLPKKNDGSVCDKDFIIVAYGKMGGIELSHNSDLDLVFIHDAAGSLTTDGPRPIDNGLFFTRLGQRIIHILTALTPSGALYEVDMRLRPSGASGLLVSSLEAYCKYQQEDAWTWEHQALVRARPVAGDAELAKKFAAFRAKLLCQPRDTKALRNDVIKMRNKMREHLLPNTPQPESEPIFHLKQGAGGIVDIEFMVQYAVLAWSHQHPALAQWTDNIRILEALQQVGLFDAAEAEALISAYKAYRTQVHRLSLQQQAGVLPLADVKKQRGVVLKMWQDLLENGLG